jgi:hypothetical protein
VATPQRNSAGSDQRWAATGAGAPPSSSSGSSVAGNIVNGTSITPITVPRRRGACLARPETQNSAKYINTSCHEARADDKSVPSAAQIGLLLPWRASALGWRICSCEISAGDSAVKLPIDLLRQSRFCAGSTRGLGARRWGTAVRLYGRTHANKAHMHRRHTRDTGHRITHHTGCFRLSGPNPKKGVIFHAGSLIFRRIMRSSLVDLLKYTKCGGRSIEFTIE